MKAWRFLTSMAVTIMLADMLLVLLAFAPAAITYGYSHHATPGMVSQTNAPRALLAGSGAAGISEGEYLAGWGIAHFWACARCAASWVGGQVRIYHHNSNSGNCRKCKNWARE